MVGKGSSFNGSSTPLAMVPNCSKVHEAQAALGLVAVHGDSYYSLSFYL